MPATIAKGAFLERGAGRQSGGRPALSNRQVLHEGKLREHRCGLIGCLQSGLQRQKLGRNLVAGDGFALIDDVLQHDPGLALPRSNVLHRNLRGREIGPDVGKALLPSLRRQARRNTLAESSDQRGRIGARW